MTKLFFFLLLSAQSFELEKDPRGWATFGCVFGSHADFCNKLQTLIEGEMESGSFQAGDRFYSGLTKNHIPYSLLGAHQNSKLPLDIEGVKKKFLSDNIAFSNFRNEWTSEVSADQASKDFGEALGHQAKIKQIKFLLEKFLKFNSNNKILLVRNKKDLSLLLYGREGEMSTIDLFQFLGN